MFSAILLKAEQLLAPRRPPSLDRPLLCIFATPFYFFASITPMPKPLITS